MTAKDLLAAAEQLLKFGDCGYHEQRQAIDLLAAFVRETVKPDDDDAVTEEWFRILGFVDPPKTGEWNGFDGLVLLFNDCTSTQSLVTVEWESRIWFGVESLEWSRNQHHRLAAIKTRGQVRRLLAVLGIPAKGE